MSDIGSPPKRLREAAKQLQIVSELLDDEGCHEYAELDIMAHRLTELATELEARENP